MMNFDHNFDDDWRRLGPQIGKDHAGLRVDIYLARFYPFHARSGWQRRIELGEVLVNRHPIKANFRLKQNDVIHFFHPEIVEPDVDPNIKVLWQSGAVMAVFKPGNLPMHENGAYRKNTFAQFLGELVGPEWSAVHRLDRETSGVVLCGATMNVRQTLANDFLRKDIAKEYQLFVNGIPQKEQWSVDGPIGDLIDSQIRIKKWVTEGGQSAQTDFSLECSTSTRDGEFAVVRAFPKTGRTNQIRIHAAYSGHWILGDKLYHPNEKVFLDYWDHHQTTDFCIQETRFKRCCLHAACLSFVHPESGERVRVESPLPDDMSDFWQQLKGGVAT